MTCFLIEEMYVRKILEYSFAGIEPTTFGYLRVVKVRKIVFQKME